MSGAGSGIGASGTPPDPRTVVETPGAALGWREALLGLKTQPGAAEQGTAALAVPAPGEAPPVDPLSQSAALALASLMRPPSTTEVALDARPPDGNSGASESGRQPTLGTNAAAATAGLPLALSAALSSAGYAQATAPALRSPDATPTNPLLNWAQASQSAPLSAAVLAAAQALPGPAASLLAQGVDPGVVITLQQGWEAAVLGGRDPIGGLDLPPLWRAWSLPNAAPLAALMQQLGGSAPGLPNAATTPPSAQLMALLGAKPAVPPPALVQAFAASAAPGSLLLMGFAPALDRPPLPTASVMAAAGLPLSLSATLSQAGYSPLPGPALRLPDAAPAHPLPPGLPISTQAIPGPVAASLARGIDPGALPKLPQGFEVAAPGNPLLDWAQASRGEPLPAALLAVAQALPGPAATLLLHGVEPSVALTLQQGWEAALLGGREPVSGALLPPLWQTWGLPSAEVLAALVRDLNGGGAPELLQTTSRPSEQLMQALDIKPALPPPAVMQAFTAGGAPASLLLLGSGGAAMASAFAGQGLSGLELLGPAPVPAGTISAASGLVAVQVPAGAPLLLMQRGPDGLPAAQQGVKLGGASVQAGISAGIPWVAADVRSATLPDAAAALMPVLLAALPHAPAQITEAALSIPFGLGPANWAPSGRVAFDDGQSVQFGAEDGGSILPGGPGGVGNAVSALQVGHMRDGQHGGDLGFAVHGERRRIPIDVTPAMPRSVSWRLDDTHAKVMLQQGGAGSAALRAAELYHALMADGGGLGLLNPGEGFSTWEGSPLWLALAGVGKPAELGVLLHETAPGRLEVLRTTEGEWLIEHAGGGWTAPRRTRHPRHALEDEALLLDVLFGVDASAANAPRFAGWRAARAHMAQGTLQTTAEATWRTQEAWAAVARSLAQHALLLRDASRNNAQDSLWLLAAAALQAAVSVPLGAPGDGPEPQPVQAERLLLAAVQSGDLRRVGALLPVYGRAVLERLLDGDIGGFGPAEGVALAACLGRLASKPDQRVIGADINLAEQLAAARSGSGRSMAFR